jgi:hypothetical protein
VQKLRVILVRNFYAILKKVRKYKKINKHHNLNMWRFNRDYDRMYGPRRPFRGYPGTYYMGRTRSAAYGTTHGSMTQRYAALGRTARREQDRRAIARLQRRFRRMMPLWRAQREGIQSVQRLAYTSIGARAGGPSGRETSNLIRSYLDPRQNEVTQQDFNNFMARHGGPSNTPGISIYNGLPANLANMNLDGTSL